MHGSSLALAHAGILLHRAAHSLGFGGGERGNRRVACARRRHSWRAHLGGRHGRLRFRSLPPKLARSANWPPDSESDTRRSVTTSVAWAWRCRIAALTARCGHVLCVGSALMGRCCRRIVPSQHAVGSAVHSLREAGRGGRSTKGALAFGGRAVAACATAAREAVARDAAVRAFSPSGQDPQPQKPKGQQ